MQTSIAGYFWFNFINDDGNLLLGETPRFPFQLSCVKLHYFDKSHFKSRPDLL